MSANAVARSLARKAYRAIRSITTARSFSRYTQAIGQDHPFKNFPKVNIGDCSVDPRECFSHYEAFSFWLTERIGKLGGRKSILDIGSKKMVNAMLSANNDVTALVLADCRDTISKVRYVIHDAADPLPFENGTFDVFTSMVTLSLIGLGRYGDKVNPYALVNLSIELNRVMKPESDLFLSMPLGKNCLHFNNSWFLEFETVCALFKKWRLVDYLVDNESTSSKYSRAREHRFTQDVNIENQPVGDYRVAFFHFKRQ